MDYRDFIARHVETGADVTISLTAARSEEGSEFGLVKIDDTGRVIEFSEKPKGEALDHMRVDTTRLGLSPEEAERRPFLASMGIYVFHKDVLRRLLLEEMPHGADFGKEIIPEALLRYNVQAHLFDGYWEDIGTIGAFYRANIEMTLPLPPFNVFDSDAPMYTRPRYLPGSKLLDCHILSSIIDKNARIGAGVQILNQARQTELDGDGYFIRDGIVIVPKTGVIPDGTVI